MMRVNFADHVTTSTIDWPGEVCHTVFFRGCSYNCYYCSNYRYLGGVDERPVEAVEDMIREAAWATGAVVFSGGEPFLQSEALYRLCAFAKSLGLKVGVQTNGSFPERIIAFFDDDGRAPLDALMIDVKGSYSDNIGFMRYTKSDVYDEWSAMKPYVTAHMASELRADGRLEYVEVRTTLFPGMDDGTDMQALFQKIGYPDAYVLQQGRPELCADPEYQKEMPLSRDRLIELAKPLKLLCDRTTARQKTKVYVRVVGTGTEEIK